MILRKLNYLSTCQESVVRNNLSHEANRGRLRSYGGIFLYPSVDTSRDSDAKTCYIFDVYITSV
jgi:hypothetical protein